jgi:hypothetical protein
MSRETGLRSGVFSISVCFTLQQITLYNICNFFGFAGLGQKLDNNLDLKSRASLRLVLLTKQITFEIQIPRPITCRVVLCGCHLIPMARLWLKTPYSAAHPLGEFDDWATFYVNMYVLVIYSFFKF